MKKVIFVFLLLVAIVLPQSNLRADSWDCMDHETAQTLADYLTEHPFIVDYCDLCDNGISEGEGQRYPLTLIHIKSVRIEICSWDSEQWSVVMETEPVVIGYLVEGFEYDVLDAFPGDFPEDEIGFLQNDLPASLNYQWTLVNGEAVRLGDAIDYPEKMNSPAISTFPGSSFIKDKNQKKAYDAFLKSNM